jgi:alpha-L-fucosidase
MQNNTRTTGAQRLSLESLREWESWGFGMFLHFGMSTYEGIELSPGTSPPDLYRPESLDVDGWIRQAKNAGMTYAVLTAKHVSGFCLWPSDHTDYHVGASDYPTDVVAEFMDACARHGIHPGIYYCSWDNHHTFGSSTPSHAAFGEAFTTRAYLDFQWSQLQELASRYPGVREWWIDIPSVLPRFYRDELYAELARRTPEAVIVMNNGIGNGSELSVRATWPTDVVTIERFVPPSRDGHRKWRTIEGADYYLPGEVCDPIGREWFYDRNDAPRSDGELLGMYLLSRERGTNLLLDVGPDPRGRIPDAMGAALNRLAEAIARLPGG